MATRKSEDIRTIAVISHGGAGKTSLTEAMLYDTGVTSRMGRVEDKNTVSDFDAEEQKRQISINTSLVTIAHKGKTVYVLDTPGFADFMGEQISALRATDSAVLVVSATGGVEVQTQRGWDNAIARKNAVVFFVSKMDREHANFTGVVSEIRESLSDRALPLFLPVWQESSFKGLVNVLTQKCYMYKGDGSKGFEETSVPAGMEDAVTAAREALIERIVEADDELMMRYLEGDTLTDDELNYALRAAVAGDILYPILPGSSTLNIGVMQLLDVIADVMPSPLDKIPRKMIKEDGGEAECKPDVNAPFEAMCFKVMVDPYVGKLSFIRVYSGKLTTDQPIFNATRGEEERISSFRLMKGKEGEDTKEVVVGDILAIPKLDSTMVGDTLSVKGNTAQFPRIAFPKPVYSVAIFPKSRADEDKLGNAINKILGEDRTLAFQKNPETNDSVLSGMGDMHIDIILSRIKERYKVDLETKTPKVPYRETIKKPAKAQGKYKKQTGGRGQYGDVWFSLTPGEKNSNIVFEDKVVGGVVPKNFIPAAEKGLREAAVKGVLAGYKATDFVCAIFDGSYHDVDSSEMAFKIAASMAFKKAFLDASPVLQEPIMNVEVTVPEECLGDVMGDFNSRRGRIMGIDSNGKLQVVKAACPLAEMFRYAIILRSMTSGRGNFTMEFSHYEEVPGDIAKKVVEAAAKDRVEEEE